MQCCEYGPRSLIYLMFMLLATISPGAAKCILVVLSHYGEIRVKLVGFKEEIKIFSIFKTHYLSKNFETLAEIFITQLGLYSLGQASIHLAKLVFTWLDLNLLEILGQIFLPGLNKNNKNLIIFLCKTLATI